MSIDLNSLSARELDALIQQAKQRKARLDKRRPIATVRGKLTALAKAEGYTIAELFGGGAGKASTARIATAKSAARTSTKGRKLGKVAPKYRNPANPEQTWAGRGQPPRWLAEQLAQGKRAEDFLIAR